jgi:hypothetical protein
LSHRRKDRASRVRPQPAQRPLLRAGNNVLRCSKLTTLRHARMESAFAAGTATANESATLRANVKVLRKIRMAVWLRTSRFARLRDLSDTRFSIGIRLPSRALRSALQDLHIKPTRPSLRFELSRFSILNPTRHRQVFSKCKSMADIAELLQLPAFPPSATI